MKDRFDETSAIWTEEYSSRCAAPAKHKRTFTPYHDRICSICELHLQTEASLRISNWQNVISCTNARAPAHSVRGFNAFPIPRCCGMINLRAQLRSSPSVLTL